MKSYRLRNKFLHDRAEMSGKKFRKQTIFV